MNIAARMAVPFRRPVALAILLLLALPGRPAAGQESDPAQLLADFVHYTFIAKPDLAAASAERLLNSGLTNAELATLVDESRNTVERFDNAVIRAQFIAELEDIAAEIATRVETGRLDLARDPQRVEESIQMLVGNLRQQRLARDRLEQAGEYAVPGLVRQLTEGRNEELKIACERMLRQIGRQAVTPLCVALPEVDAVTQRIVCDTLADIGYPHAAPALRELTMDSAAPPPVRDAARRALERLRDYEREADLSGLYADLSRHYLNGLLSLIAFPAEERNNVWDYNAHIGLVATPVPTVIYNEIMAMRTAGKAIDADAANARALALFVAANLKRENELPAGMDDPIYGDLDYTPQFFATVFGTETCLDVLGMAIDMMDTPLVRDAIAALADTTGGANLFAAASERRNPLLEAVQYPDRRVQYEAALTLARALPREGFNGDFRVVPLLASAVRTGDEAFALVISDDDENRNVIAQRLRDRAFTIIGSGASVQEVSLDISEAIGVDLIVVRMRNADEINRVVSDVRLLARTAATPVLVMAAQVDKPSLDQTYRGEPRVSVARAGVTEQEFTAAIDNLLLVAVGGRITEAEAEAYAIDSIAALRDIAITRSPAYAISDAEPSLLAALDSRSGGTRLYVADVLALMESQRAQQALFDAALLASGNERIDLLEHVANSVKRYGNLSQPRHIEALLELVQSSDGPTADAAAKVHGALNLPASNAIDLIP